MSDFSSIALLSRSDQRFTFNRSGSWGYCVTKLFGWTGNGDQDWTGCLHCASDTIEWLRSCIQISLSSEGLETISRMEFVRLLYVLYVFAIICLLACRFISSPPSSLFVSLFLSVCLHVSLSRLSASLLWISRFRSLLLFFCSVGWLLHVIFFSVIFVRYHFRDPFRAQNPDSRDMWCLGLAFCSMITSTVPYAEADYGICHELLSVWVSIVSSVKHSME